MLGELTSVVTRIWHRLTGRWVCWICGDVNGPDDVCAMCGRNSCGCETWECGVCGVIVCTDYGCICDNSVKCMEAMCRACWEQAECFDHDPYGDRDDDCPKCVYNKANEKCLTEDSE